MRISTFFPVFVLIILAGILGWQAFEPPAPFDPTALMRAGDALVSVEDQSGYAKALGVFREKLFSAGPAGFERTERALISLTTTRDKVGHRISDPGLREAIVRDSIEVANHQIQDRHFQTLLLAALLILLAATVFLFQARRVNALSVAVAKVLPNHPIGSFADNLDALLGFVKERQILVEDLQESIVTLTIDMRALQREQAQPSFNGNYHDLDSGHFTKIVPLESSASDQSFPSIDYSAEVVDRAQPGPPGPLDEDPPDLFAPGPPPAPRTDRARTEILPRQPSRVEIAPDPSYGFFQVGASSQTSELQYTQYLLGLADTPDFPLGAKVFVIEISEEEVLHLRRSYDNDQIVVRLFGHFVERLLFTFDLKDRTCLHFDETRHRLTFQVPAYLNISPTGEEILDAFKSKALFVSNSPLSLPELVITLKKI